MTFLPLANNFSFSDAAVISAFGFVLVLAVLAALAILVLGFSKVFSLITKTNKKAKDADAPKTSTVATEAKPASEPVAEKAEACDDSYIPGYVTLDGVSEQDAAVIMAITSDKTGIPLERLAFRSIKRLNQNPVLENVSEQDAAVIMAITADKTGIPLENLAFNSIKLVEE